MKREALEENHCRDATEEITAHYSCLPLMWVNSLVFWLRPCEVVLLDRRLTVEAFCSSFNTIALRKANTPARLGFEGLQFRDSLPPESLCCVLEQDT